MLISVIIPCYNCISTIVDTINSILIQNIDLEIIIIDDCSTDGSFDLVKQLYSSDQRFKLIANDINKGVGETRNIGLSLANGDYVALVDSDDIWLESKLEKQLKMIDESDCDICCTGATVIYNDGSTTDKIRKVEKLITLDKILKNNMVINSSVVMKKAVSEQVKFQRDYFHEDYVFWLDCLMKEFTIVGIDEPLMLYRLGGRSKNKINAAKARLDIYRRFMKFGIFKSCYYMWFYIMTALGKNM